MRIDATYIRGLERNSCWNKIQQSSRFEPELAHFYLYNLPILENREYTPTTPYLDIMSSSNTAIAPGSWILVTGASGFLASHLISQFLKRGFKVRGTVRDVEKASWLIQGPLKSYTANRDFELVAVPALGVEGAFDEAIKGIAAVCHTAFVTNIVPDPNEVITPTVKGVQSILDAARREPSVKRVVFTGSALNSSALSQGVDNGTVGRDSWNDAVLEAAWAPPPYGLSHAMANYAASKVAAEKEVWRYVEEEKSNLPFTVNVVSPAGITGEPLNKTHIEGQANWIVHAFRGNRQMMDPMQASK